MRIRFTTIVWCALVTPFASADGVLDPSFGNGGIVLTAVNGSGGPVPSRGLAGALSPEGKIVAVGNALRAVSSASGYDIAVARYNTDGSPDTSFGTLGQVATDLGGSGPLIDETANTVTVQADGRIVVAGTRSNSGGMFVVRYLPTGLLDPQFGAGGVVLPPVSDALAVREDALGRILVGGTTPSTPGFWRFAIVRLLTDGTLDNTFGTNGTVTLDPSGTGAGGRLYDIVMQPDGRIVASGERSDFSNSQFAVCRFLENGTPDGSFGNGGVVLTDVGPATDIAFAVGVQPDGKVVVGGYGGATDMVLVRYTVAGVPDGTFGSGGIATVPLFSVDIGRGMAIQPDGKMVIGGVGGGGDFLIGRVTDSGLLDTGFGADGILLTDLGGSEAIYELLIPDPGRLLAIGTSSGSAPGEFARFALARYTANTPVTLETFSVE